MHMTDFGVRLVSSPTYMWTARHIGLGRHIALNDIIWLGLDFTLIKNLLFRLRMTPEV